MTHLMKYQYVSLHITIKELEDDNMDYLKQTIAGLDCALNGANTENCDFRLFSSKEAADKWSNASKIKPIYKAGDVLNVKESFYSFDCQEEIVCGVPCVVTPELVLYKCEHPNEKNISWKSCAQMRPEMCKRKVKVSSVKPRFDNEIKWYWYVKLEIVE